MKFAPRFFGPYLIMGKVDPVAYWLALPPGTQIHNVFHVSMLQKHLGPVHTLVQNQLPPVSEDFVIQKGKYRPRSKVLIKWKGAPREDAT